MVQRIFGAGQDPRVTAPSSLNDAVQRVQNKTFTPPVGGFPAFASLYCILRAHLSANAINANLAKRLYSRKGLDADFRFASHWHLEAIQRDAQLDAQQLRAAVGGYWLPSLERLAGLEQQVKALTSANFRFCNVCRDDGYHSQLHQYRTNNRCRVHDCNLTDRCPECGQISRFILKNLNFGTALCHCGANYFDQMAAWQRRQIWQADMESEQLDCKSWLTAAQSLVVVAPEAGARRPSSDGVRHMVCSTGSAIEQFVTSAACLGDPVTTVPTHPGLGRIQVVEMNNERGTDVQKVISEHVLPNSLEQLNEYVASSDSNMARHWVCKNLHKKLDTTLSVLSLAAHKNHSECIRFEQESRTLVGRESYPPICEVAALLSWIRHIWCYESFVFTTVLKVVNDLWRRMLSLDSLSGFMPLIELQLAFQACTSFVGGVCAHILESAPIDRCEAAESAFRLDSTGLAAIPYSIATAVELSSSQYSCTEILWLAMLVRQDWNELWGRICHCEEGHHQEVRQRYAGLKGKSAQIHIDVDRLRGRS